MTTGSLLFRFLQSYLSLKCDVNTALIYFPPVKCRTMASAMTSAIQIAALLPAVCRISIRCGKASGFLCVSKRGLTGEEDFYLLATNNRVISDISIRSLKT